jgi:hypothetical protein
MVVMAAINGVKAADRSLPLLHDTSPSPSPSLSLHPSSLLFPLSLSPSVVLGPRRSFAGATPAEPPRRTVHPAAPKPPDRPRPARPISSLVELLPYAQALAQGKR